MNKQKIWNSGYLDGTDYIKITEEEVNEIINKLDLNKNPAALDIGCGTGDLACKLAAKGLKVTGIDISDVAIEQAQARSNSSFITYKVFDIEKDDVNKLGKFDLAVAKLSLAFIEDKPLLLQKVKCLLRPKGLLVIINPVIFNPQPEMPPRLNKISVKEEVTLSALKENNFKLTNKTEKPLSNYHKMVTYFATC